MPGWFRASVLSLVAVGCGGASSSSDASTTEDTGDSTTTTDSSTSTSTAATDSATSVGSTGEPGTGGEWISLAPLPEGPRQETAVVATADRIFVLGGFAGVQVSDLIEVYDPATDSWTTAGTLPGPMHHANAAVVAEQIWVVGFLTGVGFEADGRVFAYDPIADDWMQGDTMPTGTERGGSGTAVLDDRIYIVGGLRGGQPVADAWAFTPSTNTWMPLPDLPTPRDHLVAVAADGKIFAIGGRDGTIAGHVDRVDVYDPSSDSWSEGPPLPTSRGGMAAAAVDGRIFVSGGEGNPDDPSGVFAQHEMLDVLGGTWESLPPMPTPRHGTGAAALEGIVYIPGGATTESLGPTDVFEAWVVG